MSSILQLALGTFALALLSIGALALLMAALPRITAWFASRGQAPAPLHTTSLTRAPGEMDAETLAAITYVLRAETDRLASPKLKVTLPLNPSPWALSNQMRVLPGRIKSV